VVKRKTKKQQDDVEFPQYVSVCESCGETYHFPLEDEHIDLCNKCVEKDYREELALNRFSLEEHAETQPQKLEKWYAALVEMKDIYYGVEQDLKSVKARLDGDIRLCESADLEDLYGIQKLTEGAITSAIERHADYLQATRLQRLAWRRREILSSAVDAFRDRSSMIKVLKDLFVSQYFDRTEGVVSRKREETIGKDIRVPRRKKGGND